MAFIRNNMKQFNISAGVQAWSWASLAWSRWARMSSGFSKNRTSTGSLSSEARICSKAKDHSFSSSSLSGVLSAVPVWEGLPSPCAPCSLRPTSSILRRRLVTVVTALYRDSSSGAPWKRLYRVLENWMNWDWKTKQSQTLSRVLNKNQVKQTNVSASTFICAAWWRAETLVCLTQE